MSKENEVKSQQQTQQQSEPQPIFNEENPAPQKHYLHDELDKEIEPAVIDGWARNREVALITGSSKSGKTFLICEAIVAIATGDYWLGHKCMQGNVLLIDGEMKVAELSMRYKKILQRLKLNQNEVMTHVDVVRKVDLLKSIKGDRNLLGQAIIELAKSKPENRPEGEKYSVVVIDPAYKFINGDENSTVVIGEFMDLLQKIAEEANVLVLFAHHQSKGIYNKNYAAIDRGSGSGVTGRSVYCSLDLVELCPPSNQDAPPDDLAFEANITSRGWGRECFNVWFKEGYYHVIDEPDDSGHSKLEKWTIGVRSQKQLQCDKRRQETQQESIAKTERIAEQLIEKEGGRPVETKTLANTADISSKTVKKYINISDKFDCRADSNSSFVGYPESLEDPKNSLEELKKYYKNKKNNEKQRTNVCVER